MIIDFDHSCLCATPEKEATGTEGWMAPEVVAEEEYGYPADAFSFGGVLTFCVSLGVLNVSDGDLNNFGAGASAEELYEYFRMDPSYRDTAMVLAGADVDIQKVEQRDALYSYKVDKAQRGPLYPLAETCSKLLAKKPGDRLEPLEAEDQLDENLVRLQGTELSAFHAEMGREEKTEAAAYVTTSEEGEQDDDSSDDEEWNKVERRRSRRQKQRREQRANRRATSGG